MGSRFFYSQTRIYTQAEHVKKKSAEWLVNFFGYIRSFASMSALYGVYMREPARRNAFCDERTMRNNATTFAAYTFRWFFFFNFSSFFLPFIVLLHKSRAHIMYNTIKHESEQNCLWRNFYYNNNVFI